MTIPGFTAGASLYPMGQYWQVAAGRSDLAGGLSIIPQAKTGCWIEKYYQEVPVLEMTVVWCASIASCLAVVRLVRVGIIIEAHRRSAK